MNMIICLDDAYNVSKFLGMHFLILRRLHLVIENIILLFFRKKKNTNQVRIPLFFLDEKDRYCTILDAQLLVY